MFCFNSSSCVSLTLTDGFPDTLTVNLSTVKFYCWYSINHYDRDVFSKCNSQESAVANPKQETHADKRFSIQKIYYQCEYVQFFGSLLNPIKLVHLAEI